MIIVAVDYLAQGTKQLAKRAKPLWIPLVSIFCRIQNVPRSRPAIILTALCIGLVAVLLVGASFVLQTSEGTAGTSLPSLSSASHIEAPRYMFSINGVSRPLGVAVSPAGDRIYVTESDGLRETKVFDSEGRPQSSITPPGSDPASRVPLYVAVDPKSRVYVSDRQAHTIFIYSPSGDYLGEVKAPSGEDGVWSPMALAFDASGNLLVTDVTSGKHRILIFNSNGDLIQQFGREGTGEGELNYPNGIASDGMGRIVVADSNNGRLSAFDPEGHQLWTVGTTDTGSSLALPRGLAIDSSDRLYVADTLAHNVLVFQLGDQGPKQLFTVGSNGIDNGQFDFPNGLALSGNGHLYVADRENNRVQVWAVPKGD